MSKWLAHVKKTMKSEAGKKKTMGKKWFSHVLKTAKVSYRKHGGGEEGAVVDTTTGGRRKHSRTQKNKRHGRR